MEQQQANSPEVTSTSNKQVRWLRELRERRGREAAGAFLVEGPRGIKQALELGHSPLKVAFVQSASREGSAVAQVVKMVPTTVHLPVDDRVLRSVSDTVHSQGIIAAFPLPHSVMSAASTPDALVLVLDRVSDPGNVGTLLRSAAAARCDAVLLGPGCADPLNPKVVRSSAGGVFAVPFATWSWDRITEELANMPRRYAADAGGSMPYYEAEMTAGCAILIGNEAAGLSSEALAVATDSVRVPLAAGMESLNAGVAGSLLLFEAVRQRSVGQTGV